MADKVIPEFDLTAFCCCTLPTGEKIIQAQLKPQLMKQLSIVGSSKLSLTKTALTAIGLPQFISLTKEGVIKAYPWCGGSDDDVPRFRAHKFLSEDFNENGAYFLVPGADHSGLRAKIKSTKEVDVEVIKLKADYETVKIWLNKLEIETDKRIALNEPSRRDGMEVG